MDYRSQCIVVRIHHGLPHQHRLKTIQRINKHEGHLRDRILATATEQGEQRDIKKQLRRKRAYRNRFIVVVSIHDLVVEAV